MQRVVAKCVDAQVNLEAYDKNRKAIYEGHSDALDMLELHTVYLMRQLLIHYHILQKLLKIWDYNYS